MPNDSSMEALSSESPILALGGSTGLREGMGARPIHRPFLIEHPPRLAVLSAV